MPQQTRYKIVVTDADIERAVKADSYHCVVSQAIARSIPDAHHIEVDSQTIRFTRGDERLVYLTPYTVMGYVVAFDAGDKIEPFTFTIKQPKVVRRRWLGEKRAASQKKSRDRVKRRKTLPEVPTEKPADVNEAIAGLTALNEQNKFQTSGQGRAAPRVFKTKRRTYGHRVLRINQEREQGEEPNGPDTST